MTEPAPSTRRALAWMFMVAAVLSAVSVLFSVHEVTTSEHKFCTVVGVIIAHPVPRPADPKANPSRQNSYLFYEDFVQLSHRLGCGLPGPDPGGVRIPDPSRTRPNVRLVKD